MGGGEQTVVVYFDTAITTSLKEVGEFTARSRSATFKAHN